MPKDEWRIASNRAKYGPVGEPKRWTRKRKKRRWSRKKRIPPNFRKQLEYVFLVNIGTPAVVVQPDGAEIEMRTTKTLRFGKQAKQHLRDGCHTFHRLGYHLIVADEHVRRDTMK